MSLRQLSRTWDTFGREDPLWAILSHKQKRGNRWDLEEFLATGVTEVQEVLEHVRSVCPELRTGKALDFGCGVGRLTQAMATEFQEVHGVDVAPSMVERARELSSERGLGERCTYHLNQAPDLSLFGDDEFDFVYSNITLQHMRPSLAAGYIRDLTRVLAPGGALLFQLPGAPVRGPWFDDKPVLRHLRLLWGRCLRGAYLLWHRTLRRRPVMDLFATPPEDVKALVGAAGGEVVVVQENTRAGPGWVSYLYCVLKEKKNDRR